MIGDPHLTEDTFIARDGARLPYTVWGPRENARAVIIAAHSFGEFRDAYALIGQHMADQNVAVWAYDQRGFGDAPHPGLWSSTETMVQDFKDFVEAVRSKVEPNKPVIMLGESMGAAVVLSALSDPSFPRPRAVILSGPGVREDRPRRYWFNFGLWLVTRIVPGYAVDVPRPYDDRLSDDHAKRWSTDPKIITEVRLDTYYGLIRLSDFASNNAAASDVPTLVLYGTEDDQIHPKSICALMTRLGTSGTLKTFPSKPHLMFQDKDQDMVLELIEKWVETPGQSVTSDTRPFCP